MVVVVVVVVAVLLMAASQEWCTGLAAGVVVAVDAQLVDADVVAAADS